MVTPSGSTSLTVVLPAGSLTYFWLSRGIIEASNALGSDTWHIDDENDPQRIAMDRFNRLVADDPEFEASIIPLRNGVLVGRRM